MLLSRCHFSRELTSCGHWRLAEVNEMLWDILFPCSFVCLSAVETLIEQLHKAWDVQPCLFVFKLVVKRKDWSHSLTLRSAQACCASRLRHGNQSWLQLLESVLVLGLSYTSTLLNRPRSDPPRGLYNDLSCHIKDSQNRIYYLNFLKKKRKYCISSVHMRTKPKNLYRNQKDPFVLWFRQIANYKWTCIFWLLTPWDLFHKTSFPNRPGLFQLVWLIVKWFGSIKQI